MQCQFRYPRQYHFLFFFFQAEDGIRDPLVTGVQTCALPIWYWLTTWAPPQSMTSLPSAASLACSSADSIPSVTKWNVVPPFISTGSRGWWVRMRSEERRVGKECRSRRWRKLEEQYEVVSR